MVVGALVSDDAAYLREQAERCFRLALQTTDPDVREILRALGREFERKVTELERKDVDEKR